MQYMIAVLIRHDSLKLVIELKTLSIKLFYQLVAVSFPVFLAIAVFPSHF